MGSEHATCWRCGIKNVAREVVGYLCASCKVYADAHGRKCRRCGKRCRTDNAHPELCGHCAREPEHRIILAGGRWVRDGLVYRWETDPTQTVRCGTEQGYNRHTHRHETPCSDCREAHRIHRAQQRQNEEAA